MKQEDDDDDEITCQDGMVCAKSSMTVTFTRFFGLRGRLLSGKRVCALCVCVFATFKVEH